MASPNLKDTYTYDNIYKIEINDNFIIHGKGDFAYRKNLYNIRYETIVNQHLIVFYLHFRMFEFNK